MNRTPPETDLTLGVIGGMGPLATADFLAKLVEATPVAVEQEHLRVLVDSNPKVPDRIGAIAGTSPSSGPTIVAMANGLERAGADFLVMICNTAHHFEPAIRAAVGVPFVSMIEEACEACDRSHPQARRVGLLATRACIASGMYQRALEKRGLGVVLLGAEDDAAFALAIAAIKREGVSQGSSLAMKRLAESLVAAGADLIMAACTEVPLVLEAAHVAVPLLDTTAHLAQRCVRYARRLEPLPLGGPPE